MIKLYDVYKEVFNKLKELPYNVYDEVPQVNSNPHIRVDYSYESENSGKNYDSKIYYQYIHIFSDYQGRKEILKITDDVLQTLSENIEASNFIMYPHLERCDITQESDRTSGPIHGYHTNETYRHAVIVIRYTIYEK